MRRLSLLSALVELLVLSLSPARVFAQIGGAGAGNRVTVTGTVFSSSDNRRIAQASVRLCDAGGTQIEETSTNESGEFSIRDIERNRYILSISALGYESQDVHLDLSFTSERGTTIVLKPVPDKSASSAPASSVSAHEMSMPQKARDLMASGMKKIYQDKDPKGGLADLEQATKIAPGYYEAYYQLAMAHLAANQNDEAEEAFQKSIKISGDKYGEAEVGLGTMLLNQGDNAGGEKDIRHGIELSPNFWFGYYELGRALLNDKQVADAEKAGLQARSLAPGAPLVYRLLAIVHMDQKNYPALLDDLDQYIKLDPDSPAGQRAKELRSQVAQKEGDQKATASTEASSK
jgi:tetratricopeptide (TPR) repeat protein